ncbi:MAG: HNH endonuclease [Planctomycetota bacterium]
MSLADATLVLNRNWIPVNVTSVRHALVLMYQDVARGVDPVDYSTYSFVSWTERPILRGEPFVQTTSLRIRCPEVIVLATYAQIPSQHVAFSRRNIYRRDNFTCQYCGEQPGVGKLSVDHVLPRSRGGPSTWENCVLACIKCNRRKGARTPREAGLRLRTRPQRPLWHPRLLVGVNQRKPSWSHFLIKE